MINILHLGDRKAANFSNALAQSDLSETIKDLNKSSNMK